MKINSRSKGNRGETQACQVMGDWTGYKFARVPSSGGLRWKKENTQGDICLTEEGIYFPFSVEVKNVASLEFTQMMYCQSNILDFWKQCEDDATRANKLPLLMMRQDRLAKKFFFLAISYAHYLKFKSLLHFDKPFFIYSKKIVILHPDILFQADYQEINLQALRLLNRDKYGRKR